MGVITFLFEFFSILLYVSYLLYLFTLKKDYRTIIQIIFGSIFGITLEFMTVFVFETYKYSPYFIIQIGQPPSNIPICIGLCWGLIIYSCIRVTDHLNIAKWSRPIVDSLMGLTIDFSMDTIAIRIEGGFWTWINIPLESWPTITSFFGVSYGNFLGWFLVVMSFSSLTRFEDEYIYQKYQKNNSLSILFYILSPIIAYIFLLSGLILIPIPLSILILGHVPANYLDYQSKTIFNLSSTSYHLLENTICPLKNVRYHDMRRNSQKSFAV